MYRSDEDIYKDIKNLINEDKDSAWDSFSQKSIDFKNRKQPAIKKTSIRHFSFLQVASVLLIVSTVFMLKNHNSLNIDTVSLGHLLSQSVMAPDYTLQKTAWFSENIIENESEKLELQWKVAAMFNHYSSKDYSRQEFEELVSQALTPDFSTSDMQIREYRFNKEDFENKINQLKEGKDLLFFNQD